MKYLVNDGDLTVISSQLSGTALSESRTIQGRIEAYSMKRGGSDKKYAFALGQRYKEEVDDLLQEEMQLYAAAAAETDRLAQQKEEKMKQQRQGGGKHTSKSSKSSKPKGRKRSNSTPASPPPFATKQQKVPGQLSPRNRSISVPEFSDGSNSRKNKKKESSSHVVGEENQNQQQQQRRPRSQSFDDFTLDSLTPKTTIGDFSEQYTRRLMTDLVLTLNASFPDYDFSNVRPSQFHKADLATVRKTVFDSLSELAAQKESESPNFLVKMWSAIDDVISINDCDIYSFDGSELFMDDDDQGGDTSLWTFHYFFVNRSMRRIVYFTCSEKIDEDLNLVEEDIGVDGGALGAASGGGAVEDDTNGRTYDNTDVALVDDFDWDPSDNVAGGMSFDVAIA
eukprot:CAMPEP_0113453998 /NCGR_PEP_ID=MMETSP0014_2-20120614/7641_1 /TAXON_ID=2857 /ORGANISM="Nitzschia sp." /LENGTH=394 /DNA_ID=CAMNT_0000345399 /DNA_START=291 /DNA_END=1475 /DNA_ORIENTATION=- /assembly_acc=CAM_ASM_000159